MIETDWELFDECYPELADPGPSEVAPEIIEAHYDQQLKQQLIEIINTQGLDKLLSMLMLALAERNAPYNESYINNVIAGLEKTLDEYRKRYTEDE